MKIKLIVLIGSLGILLSGCCNTHSPERNPYNYFRNNCSSSSGCSSCSIYNSCNCAVNCNNNPCLDPSRCCQAFGNVGGGVNDDVDLNPRSNDSASLSDYSRYYVNTPTYHRYYRPNYKG